MTHRVLFLYMSDTDLAQMRHLANGLMRTGPFEVFSCALAEGLQIFRAGFSDEAPSQKRPAHLRKAEGGKSEKRSARAYAEGIAGYEPLKSLRVIRGILLNAMYWGSRRREAEDFIRKNKIDSVITCNDTTLYYLPILQAARTLDKVVILARSANIFHHDESDGCKNSMKHLMRARMPQMHVDKADSGARTIANWLVRWLFPGQIAETIWGRLVPYQSTDILSLACAGIRPDQLWHLGPDWTNYLIVSGDDEAQALKSYGISSNRVLPIGSVAFEHAHELLQRRDALRTEICRELGLRADKPIILFTVPAGWEHRTYTYEQQFGFLRAFFSMLSKFDSQIVLSLHPLSRREDYEEIAAEFSLKFLSRQLIDSIVFTDIFLGADNSSVLRWAIAAGIPTMNFQFNPDNLDLVLHAEYPSMTDRDEFTGWLAKQVTRCPIPTRDLLAPQRRPMGLIADGRFFQRLADVLLQRPQYA